ncbi:alpha/beta fold hydrolase [Paraburkholderia sp. JHI869]|uniref:alpha/beta fold hydrolase n=1 Tax=Paraburkholderia sp. JHI869 TaxID=3112959 RepID=UPI00316B5C48
MNPTSSKIYMLVHGAAHGGWCWKEVATLLRSKGHTVYTPTQTGLGERSHLVWTKPNLEVLIEDVAQVFRYEDLRDVILVGHSFGGLTVSALADRIPECLRHVVYLDATVLTSGECAMDRMPAELAERYKQRALESGGVSVATNPPAYFGVTDPAKSSWLQTKITPQPYQPYLDKLYLKNPLGNGLPVTYIACTSPSFDSLSKSREIAKSTLGWRYVEMPTGHNAMTLIPDELARTLAEIN